MKEAPIKIQPNKIYLSPSPNIPLECPNAPKKRLTLDDAGAIPECLQMDSDHVPFQLDRSNRSRLSFLRDEGSSFKSVSVNISEHLLIPDLDDE